MTSGRVGSGALLGLSERTALESRNAFGKEKPVCRERMGLEDRREPGGQTVVWKWPTKAESFESRSDTGVLDAI